MSDEYETLIESLPDDEETIENTTATLLFIGEAWINHQAREVDGKRIEFDVPLADLYVPMSDPIGSPGAETGEWYIHGTFSSHHISDAFHRHENAPEWVQEWSGPFTIKLQTWGI